MDKVLSIVVHSLLILLIGSCIFIPLILGLCDEKEGRKYDA